MVTVVGPLAGAVGWFLQITWLFWVGVAVCVITLLINMKVGTIKVPVLPIGFMISAAVWHTSWFIGAGMGLIAWTALDAAGELIGLWREGRL